MVRELEIAPAKAGLHEVTAEIESLVADWVRVTGKREGLCTVFVRHTSASLLIQENADPDVRRDLDAFFARLVPEGDPLYRHTTEGPDDMPSHVRSALTSTSLSIPILAGRLTLGTWQGVYLWEHRRKPSRRELVVHLAE
ncbi:MAG TPA: secondary thiamine-phosphate synthase enzyme YjbQ [Myxococcota bacterium]|nr:secondary thiamine-phosphate synthase enzyme YjbQ [Myxococcota bacterium]